MRRKIITLLISCDETFDSTRKYLKIEPRMPPPVGGDELSVFVMAPGLTYLWQVTMQSLSRS